VPPQSTTTANEVTSTYSRLYIQVDKDFQSHDMQDRGPRLAGGPAREGKGSE
jgi:hypothetical protein